MRRWLSIALLSLGCSPASSGDADGATTTDATTTDATTDAASDPSTPTDTGTEQPAHCPAGDVVLETDAEVAALAGCTHIFGSLAIVEGVTDLGPLGELRRVDGTLRVEGHPVLPTSLTSLAGLDALESVGALTITSVDVPDLQPLAGLKEIPGDVALGSLSELASLEGLHNLESVGGALSIAVCKQLKTDLSGLRGLRRVGADLRLNNVDVTSLHGLEGLTQVGEAGGPTALIELSLARLTSLDGLGVAWHDAHALLVFDTRITDLDRLAGAVSLRSLALQHNTLLTDIDGLGSLEVVEGELELQSNSALSDLGALARLRSVGAFTLTYAKQVSDLSPLTALAAIGRLTVDHSGLTDLGPLPALQTIDHVDLGDNDELTGLAGLAGLTELQSLRLAGNHALATLADLSALHTVAGDVEIRRNEALTSVADLDLLAVDGRLVVVVNPELPQADALAWAEPIAVGGARKIAGNKDPGPLADPCPWQLDGECDEPEGGIGVCVPDSDVEDCTIIHD